MNALVHAPPASVAPDLQRLSAAMHAYAKDVADLLVPLQKVEQAKTKSVELTSSAAKAITNLDATYRSRVMTGESTVEEWYGFATKTGQAVVAAITSLSQRKLITEDEAKIATQKVNTRHARLATELETAKSGGSMTGLVLLGVAAVAGLGYITWRSMESSLNEAPERRTYSDEDVDEDVEGVSRVGADVVDEGEIDVEDEDEDEAEEEDRPDYED